MGAEWLGGPIVSALAGIVKFDGQFGFGVDGMSGSFFGDDGGLVGMDAVLQPCDFHQFLAGADGFQGFGYAG